jgi:mRNA interferase RelE/StbE
VTGAGDGQHGRRAIRWAPAAEKDLRRLDRSTQERVRQALVRLAETGWGDVRRLQGVEDEFRLRVGDWRVRFRFDDATGALDVLRVLPRGRAYRD